MRKVQVSYQGLDPALKKAVFERDVYRCRWCGQQRSWLGFDAHHIEYRRGVSYDRLDNLITLCRFCHNFVHDSYKIAKVTAQEILLDLVVTPAQTGAAILRRIKAVEAEQKPGLSGDAPDGGVGRVLG